MVGAYFCFSDTARAALRFRIPVPDVNEACENETLALAWKSSAEVVRLHSVEDLWETVGAQMTVYLPTSFP
jgi:hypothetical protein